MHEHIARTLFYGRAQGISRPSTHRETLNCHKVPRDTEPSNISFATAVNIFLPNFGGSEIVGTVFARSFLRGEEKL